MTSNAETFHKPIVVVEDNPFIAEQIVSRLNRNGYPAIATSSPGQSIRLVERLHPRVVITDLALPEMDGLALCRILRGIFDPPKVYVLTGSAVDADFQKLAKTYGAEAAFEKPWGLAQLMDVLKATEPGKANPGSAA